MFVPNFSPSIESPFYYTVKRQTGCPCLRAGVVLCLKRSRSILEECRVVRCVWQRVATRGCIYNIYMKYILCLYIPGMYIYMRITFIGFLVGRRLVFDLLSGCCFEGPWNAGSYVPRALLLLLYTSPRRADRNLSTDHTDHNLPLGGRCCT